MRARALLALVVVASTVAGTREVRAQSCQNSLNKNQYPGGFNIADFSNLTNAGLTALPGSVILAGGQTVGQAVSQLISTEIPPASVGDYTIGKILIHATASFPLPCPGGAALGGSNNTRIDLYWSTDNGTTWYLVNFPPGTTTVGDVLVDPLAYGVSGNRLMWRAMLLTSTFGCQPLLTGISVGYEGMYRGVYQTTEPIPIGNVMLRASYELPSAAWADRTPRGHLQAKLLYSLDTFPLTDYTDPMHTPPNAWAIGDAGASITYLPPAPPPGTGPDVRQIIWNSGGNVGSFAAGVANLYQTILVNAVRGVTYLGQPVYDFDGSTVVDDNDAAWLVYWVRGWANGYNRSTTRAWGLGAIQRSTPAVVGPPGDPWWLSLGGTPSTERVLFGLPCGDTPEPPPPPAPVLPVAPANPTFLQQRRFRNTVAIVGSQDGLFHAFEFGKFRWCDDLGTSVSETRGWFSYRGARNYGDGHEVWAYAPPGQMDALRKQPARALPWSVAQGLPRANVDAAVTVADVCLPPAPVAPPPGGNATCQYKTVMMAAETRDHPFVTALDVTDPAFVPKPLWSEDWPPAVENDTTFQGTEQSLSVGPVAMRNNGPGTLRRWEAATTSGIGSLPADLYLYLIDLQLGRTYNSFGVRDGWGRVRLNLNGGNANCSGQVYGSAGPPVMVDSDVDGVVDRVYVVDTKGCLYKVETGTMSVCVMASLGETVYAPMAVRVATDVSARVELFIGGGDNPDRLDLGNAHHHLFALEDDDVAGGCSVPKYLFSVDLTPAAAPPGVIHKLWSAPVVSGDAVYVGTSVGDLNDPCGIDPLNPGVLQAWEITPAANAGPKQVIGPVALGGNSVGGIRLYDGHLFSNGSNGTTTVFGRPSSWSTSITSVNVNGGQLFSTPLWQER